MKPVNFLEPAITGLANKDLTREEYLEIHGTVKKLLGCDAATAFSDAVTAEAEQFFVEDPDDLPNLWRRMLNLAKEEGKL